MVGETGKGSRRRVSLSNKVASARDGKKTTMLRFTCQAGAKNIGSRAKLQRIPSRLQCNAPSRRIVPYALGRYALRRASGNRLTAVDTL